MTRTAFCLLAAALFLYTAVTMPQVVPEVIGTNAAGGDAYSATSVIAMAMQPLFAGLGLLALALADWRGAARAITRASQPQPPVDA